MKIVFFAPRFHTNQVSLILKLKNNGHEVNFYESIYSGKNRHDASPVEINILNESILSKTLNTVMFRKKRPFSSLFQYSKIMRIDRPDLIITRDRSVQSFLVNLVAYLYRVKIILYVQNRPEIKDGYVKKTLKQFLPKISFSPILPNAHFGDNKNKILWMPLPVESRVLNKEYFKGGKINFISVAKLDQERKRVAGLIDLFASLLREKKNLYLKIVGKNNSQERLHDLNQLIKSYEIQDHVTIIDNAPFTDMHLHYRDADIFILNSIQEPFSISLLEAMSNKLVVMAIFENGSSSYITNYKNGILFNESDQEKMKKDILNLIENPQSIIQIGNEAYNTYKNLFSDTIFYERFLNLVTMTGLTEKISHNHFV